MVGFDDVKGLFAAIGIPATLIILIILALEFGWTPFDTVTSKASKAAETAMFNLESHRQQTQALQEQIRLQQLSLDRMVQGLKEICFNTATNDERKRRCGML